MAMYILWPLTQASNRAEPGPHTTTLRLAILRNKTDPEILMELMHLVKDAEDMTFSTAFFNKDGVDELFKVTHCTRVSS